MNETLRKNCALFTDNRKALKEVFKYENESLISVNAAMLINSEQPVSAASIKACNDLLKAQTGIFSNFRSTAQMPVVTMLASKPYAAAKLEKTLQYYKTLKEEFFGSEYLVLAATILSDMVSEGQISGVAARAKRLYKLMKEDHPFLTSVEDSVFAAMMAVSDKADDQTLINEAEAAYQLLKKTFSSGNDVQTVAFILALAEGDVTEKCQRVVELYNLINASGVKYGKYYELSVLAALSLLPVPLDTLTEEILTANTYLANEKAYKGLFGLDKKTRLMHAAMIVNSSYASSKEGEIAAVTGTLAMIAAQQVALMAAICATSAAAANASSSN